MIATMEIAEPMPLELFLLQSGEFDDKLIGDIKTKTGNLASEHDPFQTGDWRERHNRVFIAEKIAQSDLEPTPEMLASPFFDGLTPRQKQVRACMGVGGPMRRRCTRKAPFLHACHTCLHAYR